MIKSFKDKETEKIFHQEFSKTIPAQIQKIVLRKLMMMHAAKSLSDLKVPPGNRLEPLKGDRAGQWSIRINEQYRIVFIPIDNGQNYIEVEVIDYH